MPFPVRSTIPLVVRFTAVAQSMLGGSVSVGHALKRSLVALGEAQSEQGLKEIRRWSLRCSQETKDLRRTPEQWREVQRRSWGPPHDIAEIPLANKPLLDLKETLSALYMSRMRLQGHRHRIRDDPVRWALF